jgi:hypothetical protein
MGAALTEIFARPMPGRIMSIPRSLPFRDDRQFGLFSYQHGHSFALIRGFPTDPDSEGGEPGPLVDLLFRPVVRVACWKSFSPIAVRYATAEESSEIQRRIGPLRPRHKIYLLEPDTIESYIIASELLMAEYLIGGGAESPLVSADPDYLKAHSARTGPIAL